MSILYGFVCSVFYSSSHFVSLRLVVINKRKRNLNNKNPTRWKCKSIDEIIEHANTLLKTATVYEVRGGRKMIKQFQKNAKLYFFKNTMIAPVLNLKTGASTVFLKNFLEVWMWGGTFGISWLIWLIWFIWLIWSIDWEVLIHACTDWQFAVLTWPDSRGLAWVPEGRFPP